MVDTVNESLARSPETDASLQMRLVEVALDHLRMAPVEQLSLRQVAQDLGVSHQAPYVHFGSKRRFLAAVAGIGLDRAAAQAEARIAAAGTSPLARLDALATAYAAWVRDDPHVHDLDHVLRIDKSEHPWLQAAATRYWDLLYNTVAACQPPGVGEPDVLRRCIIAWGVVYGIARLAALDQVPGAVPGDAEEHIRQALAALYTGWQVGT